MKWFKNLFKSKKKYNNIGDFTLFMSNLVPVEEVLTEEQIENVESWYEEHKDHVHRLIQEAETFYPPSEPEDKNWPVIWKPEYWNWYFTVKQLNKNL